MARTSSDHNYIVAVIVTDVKWDSIRDAESMIPDAAANCSHFIIIVTLAPGSTAVRVWYVLQGAVRIKI